jgi:hypothetical protein
MPVFALITNGVVTNLIDAPADWPEGVNVTALAPRPGIGWTFANGVFTAPPVEPGPVLPTTTPYMTQYGWLSRITQPKRTAIRNLAKTDEVLDDGLFLFQIAGRVDVSLTETQQLVGYLQMLGVIDAADAVALLAPIAIDSPHANP